MGYPVNKDLNYINPMQLDFLTQDFIKIEDIRMMTSMSHKDAIETTNLGLDWYQRAINRGDRGGIV